MRPTLSLLLPATLVLATAACSSSPKPPYRVEAFREDSPFQHHYAASAERTCEAARRSLLSQGYIITEKADNRAKAEKSFQPDPEAHIVLQFNVVCADTTDGSVAYASVLQSHYAVKKSASNAGVSISALGSISLPWTGMSDSMVRVGGETITDERFYTRFFDLVEKHVSDLPEPPPPAQPQVAAAPVVPPPAPVLAPQPAPPVSPTIAQTPPGAAESAARPTPADTASASKEGTEATLAQTPQTDGSGSSAAQINEQAAEAAVTPASVSTVEAAATPSPNTSSSQ